MRAGAESRVPPTIIISDADGADDERRERRDGRHAGDAICATLRNSRCAPLREDQLLALLGRVGLDDAHAAERSRRAGR